MCINCKTSFENGSCMLHVVTMKKHFTIISFVFCLFFCLFFVCLFVFCGSLQHQVTMEEQNGRYTVTRI